MRLLMFTLGCMFILCCLVVVVDAAVAELPGNVAPCANGTYGSNCSRVCGECYDGQTCDALTGHCPRCAAGFLLPLCDTECAEGLYGQDCRELCGACRDNTTCDVVNGTCPDGCRDDFTGEFCLYKMKYVSHETDLIRILIGCILVAALLICFTLVFVLEVRMVCQHIGNPFALQHINRAHHRRMIPDRCLKAYAKSLCTAEALNRKSFQRFPVKKEKEEDKDSEWGAYDNPSALTEMGNGRAPRAADSSSVSSAQTRSENSRGNRDSNDSILMLPHQTRSETNEKDKTAEEQTHSTPL